MSVLTCRISVLIIRLLPGESPNSDAFWEKNMPELSAVGIDLGTTYSSVAVVNENGTASLLPNVNSERSELPIQQCFLTKK